MRPLAILLPILLIASAANQSLAGDLTPPVGPVAPTHKTLTLVEPRTPVNAATTPGDADSLFRISQPGSYYLTGNIAGVAAKHGIEIASAGVTLDLNGFDLLGGAGTLDGIFTSLSLLANVTILNGSVRSWGGDGVDCNGFPALNNRIEGVVASNNTGFGIRAGANCIIVNCAANQNGTGGIQISGVGTISTSTCRNNTGNGFSSNATATFLNCTASGNTNRGFNVTTGCTFVGCTAPSNTGNGFTSGDSCTFSACTTLLNSSNGFVTGFNCTLTACSATSNAGFGISTLGNCTIQQCTADFNGLEGILVSNACLVRGNMGSANGQGASVGAGIHVSGSGNTIEGNTVVGNDIGYDVDGPSNFIARNTASGNGTNWTIANGNICLVVSAAAAGVINGNAGGAAPGSTDPNANFSY